MPLTMYARDAMLDELASQITHIGLFEDGTPIGSVTGAASTDTFTLNGHGLTDGTLVFLSDLMGGNGLVEGPTLWSTAPRTRSSCRTTRAAIR